MSKSLQNILRRAAKVVLVAALTAAPLTAVEVSEPELQSTGSIGDSVQFQSYAGPQYVIETAAAITGIGTALGQQVALEPDREMTVQPYAKYSLVHAVDPGEQGKLDADIFVLNDNAQVDHIRNLRRILSGYLAAAYGYDADDADVIAVFVTLYNAVYRQQIDVFRERYKDVVLGYLDEQKVGLGTNWQDWAGNTQIVIPLSDLSGGISAVDTSVISDDTVMEALRQDDDKGVEVREQLDDIKEREAVSATERAQAAQRDATVQRQAGNTEQAQQSAQEATVQQQIADRKNTEVRTDRQNIETDRTRIDTAAPEQVDMTQYVTGLFGSGDNGLYRLVTINGYTGQTVRSSPVAQVHRTAVYAVENVRVANADGTYDVFDELYVAICGVNDGHSAVRLCLLDAQNLELQLQSSEVLSDESDLVQYGDSFYVIMQSGGRCYVGMYDKNLALLHQSQIAVRPSSPVNITGSGLLVTDASGTPRMLSPSDLSTIW